MKREPVEVVKTIPINVHLEGLPVLVIGGGAVALEKITKLLPYGPRITVVSPSLHAELKELADAGALTYVADCYRPEYLAGYKLVFSATDDRDVSEAVYAATRERCVLLNTVDDPAFCDFIMPAVAQGRHMSIAFCSGGKAAGVSRRLREEMERYMEREDDILELVHAVRDRLKRKFDTFDERRAHLLGVLDALDALEAGSEE